MARAMPGRKLNTTVDQYLDKLSGLDSESLARVRDLLAHSAMIKKREKSRGDFIAFTKNMWPGFIEGHHHGLMADAFERVARGELKRLIVNMPPRHTKSEFASYLLPAWFLGSKPSGKVIQTSHTAELAVSFGRKVRNLVGSKDYQEIFPGVGLQADSKAAGRWNTNAGGEYFAIGVGGAVTGKGADLLIIDDPHAEAEAQSIDGAVYDRVYEWFTSGPRQRLQPGGSIVIVATRWHKRDLTGQIIRSSIERTGVDEWEVIELPAILPSGEALWPGFWSIEELEKLQAELPAGKWQAQYQQDPTSEGAAIIKRDWWQEWDKEDPPKCEFIIQSWDTAFLKSERADYSALTTWGVFYRDNDAGKKVANIILLDAMKERLEFPALKKAALAQWTRWKPDAFIVESKAAGWPLIFELRAMGIPVQEFTPSRGNDKIARVNAVADLFASGIVWRPANKRFAEEVMEEFASFPVGEHDDLVDSSTQALLRFRQGGFVPLESDEEEERFRPKKAEYY